MILKISVKKFKKKEIKLIALQVDARYTRRLKMIKIEN